MQRVSFQPQRSPLAHEVVDLEATSSHSQHADSEPILFSTPKAASIGKRQSKLSQWAKSPWTTFGKKKPQQIVDLPRSTATATTSTEVDVEHLFNTNRLPMFCTLRVLPRFRPDNEFWARIFGKFDNGYYENTHLQAWSLYLLERRERNSKSGRWTIMPPGFVESFAQARSMDGQAPLGDGSMAYYPAWHTVDRVYIAINIPGTHWVLGELHLESWHLTLYDSGGTLFTKQVPQLLTSFKARLHEYLREIRYFSALRQQPYQPKIKIKYPSYPVPVQSGMLGDCGPWWCIFVEQRTQGLQVSGSNPTSEYTMAFHRRMASIFYSTITEWSNK